MCIWSVFRGVSVLVVGSISTRRFLLSSFWITEPDEVQPTSHHNTDTITSPRHAAAHRDITIIIIIITESKSRKTLFTPNTTQLQRCQLTHSSGPVSRQQQGIVGQWYLLHCKKNQLSLSFIEVWNVIFTRNWVRQCGDTNTSAVSELSNLCEGVHVTFRRHTSSYRVGQVRRRRVPWVHLKHRENTELKLSATEAVSTKCGSSFLLFSEISNSVTTNSKLCSFKNTTWVMLASVQVMLGCWRS